MDKAGKNGKSGQYCSVLVNSFSVNEKRRLHGNKCAPQKRGMSVKRTFLSKGRANDTDFDKNH